MDGQEKRLTRRQHPRQDVSSSSIEDVVVQAVQSLALPEKAPEIVNEVKPAMAGQKRSARK